MAGKNHVVLRALGVLFEEMVEQGDYDVSERLLAAIHTERLRIRRALDYLHAIIEALENVGCDVAVIKSLDHWPDLGSDLDLYTRAHPSDVIDIMTQSFSARLAPRSWGDRLANKWNFLVPGLPEPVEVHCALLGQTGEQASMGSGLAGRTVRARYSQHEFCVPSPADRVLLSTLQRMYRHFYVRLCDIVDIAGLLESGTLSFDTLRKAAEAGGIWKGAASLLAFVSSFVGTYRGGDLPLPDAVREASVCTVDQLRLRRDFLRVPLLPHAARLYSCELWAFLSQAELRSAFRLSLLPALAFAAALQQGLTGSDKGVW